MTLGEFGHTAEQWTFRVDAVTGADYPATGDSVRIVAACGIADTLSNIQAQEGNHRVPLRVGTIPIVYYVNVGPNPMHRSEPGGGTEIRVEPSVKQPQFVDFEVSITLFDPVGNVVEKRVFESRDAPAPTVSFVWTGRNRRGRAVGPGTYLALIRISDHMRMPRRIERYKIGVAH
jgi:hypothetical protein